MRRFTNYVSVLMIFLTVFSSYPQITYAGEIHEEDVLLTETTEVSDAVMSYDVFEDGSDAGNDTSDVIINEGTKGDASDHIQIEVNKEEEENCGTLGEMFFDFTIDKPGYIQPFLKKTNDISGGIGIEIFSEMVMEGKGVLYGSTTEKEYNNKLPIVGLRPGKYVVRLKFNKNNMGFALKINHTQCDNYEEEQDSALAPKKISLGQFYYGMCTPLDNYDVFDYYCFELSKKSKVTITGSASGADFGWDMEVHIFGPDGKEMKGADGANISFSVQCDPGEYYIKIFPWQYKIGQSNLEDCRYKFMVTDGKSSGKKGKNKKTGTASMNGVQYDSLKATFKAMTEAKDYTVDLVTDMDGEGNLTIPGKPTSVTINGNGHTIRIIGSKLTSNASLKLNNVTVKTTKKNDKKSKFRLTAKKDLEIGEKVEFDTLKPSVKVSKTLRLTGDLNAAAVTAGTLSIEGGNLTVNENDKVTVKTAFKSVSGNITLGKGFNKPIILKGSAEGVVSFSGQKQDDGTQILSAKQDKIDPDTLKKVFNVTGIRDNKNDTYLYYFKKGKAGIFGESIRYNGKNYGLWKDAVAQMNTDKSSDSQFNVELTGDVNAGGALTMPGKGYKLLSVNSIDGKHKLTFTGNIKLTGDTSISDSVTLTKVDKKGKKVSGKVIKKKYNYTGRDTF